MIYIIFQLAILLITSIIFYFSKMPIDMESFVRISQYGTVIIITIIMINYIYYKKIITAYTIIFFTFSLFQFGLPILYAINSEYISFYIEVQSVNNLIFSAKYSIICIQLFNLGASLFNNNNKCKKNIKSSIFEKSKFIEQIAKLLFIVTGIIAIPLAITVAMISYKHGYSYVKVDTMGIYNPINQFAKTMFIPATFLWLIYCEKKKTRNRLLFIIIFYSLISMSSGGRTEGLGLLLVILYYALNSNGNINVSKKVLRNVLVLFGGLLLLTSLTYIAQNRMGINHELSIINSIEKTIEEMGFNFTSICFTRQYIPNTLKYQMGTSYINSLICLIPKSLDPTGTVLSLYNNLPELWLANSLNQTYGNLYEFGVGYSIIAESYYNFGNYGWIAVMVIGILVQWLIGKDYCTLSKFNKYIQLIMLWSLITFPRRGFYELMKSIEYNIFTIIVIIFCMYQFHYRKLKNTINYKNNIKCKG